MQLEHQDIRLCYQELEQADYTTIEKFYTLLDQHIRFEERDFFPLLEKTLTPDELQAIGDKLQHLSHQSCARYPIKFWE
jgi:hemerythrin-like domain-containing protein